MNRGVLTILVFALCVFIAQPQQCSHTAMQATAAKLTQYLANFTDPNYVPTNFDTQ
eukprot:gene9024-1122_t